MAAAVVGGLVIARNWTAAAAPDDEDEPKETGGILDEVARILNEAAARQDQDSTAPLLRPPYAGGDVNGYERKQCLNPRGHATGDCTHEPRWVSGYTRRGSRYEEEGEGAEA
ncbi:hypothetical protein ABZT26_35295 [Streptomyces sp. NPDC005395]|uniref:hypothetical protein n=1 Tax=Streptomyces sp. NPDC005395 TaxID=3157042 RepID=UPI0033A3439E